MGIVFISALLLVFGCSQNPSQNPVIKLGCAAPLTGDQAQIGIDMCNGAKLAVDQANANGKILPGYSFELYPLDDQHNPAQAVNVAKKYVSDGDVITVIGHFNSSCTKPASAVYHEAGMVQITPASTNPELSKQGFKTFFRISATDDVQGPKGAIFAVQNLKVQRIFIIDDKTTYGKGLADEFEKEAVKQGLEILGHEGITQGDKDFTPLLTKIKPLNPDLIYFGGIYPEAALLIRQSRSLDLTAVFMGGDGIATPLFVELATKEIAEGTYATMVGGDIYKVPAAAQFIQDYEARYGRVGIWSAYGFDAANVLIETIIKAGKKDRLAVLTAIREIPSFQGITGPIQFDEKGDNQNQFIGIFKVTNGKLAYMGPAEA